MALIGEIVRTYWYVFEDGVFSFHTAFNEGNDRPITFRSSHASWPSITATKLGVQYTFMRNSTPNEITIWLTEHPEHGLKGMQEVTVREEDI